MNQGGALPWSPARIALQGVGVLVAMLLWEFLGQSGTLGRALPALSAVLEYAAQPRASDLLLRATAATASAAALGFLIGALSGILIAGLAVLAPLLHRGLDQLSAFINAIPLIALGPVLIVTVGRDATPVAIAALTVFFGVYVATAAGLAGTRRSATDLFRSLGASRFDTLLRLQLPSAVPRIVDGLRLTASAAIVGAILGEWFGAPAGIGLLIVSSMQNFQIELLWSAALAGVLLSVLAFALFGVLPRWTEARFQ